MNLLSTLSYIVWSIDPDIFVIPKLNHPVRWYGLLFAGGFIVSQQIMYYIYRKERKPEREIDILTVHMILGTVLGARLGHCLFYDPVHYLSNPIEILKIWEGGLASHGGALGIFTAVWIYSNYDVRVKMFPIIKGFLAIPVKLSSKKKKREGQSFAYMLDRLTIVVALTGAMIRTGNFMNSEMIGIPTNSDSGIVFARSMEDRLDYNIDQLEKIEFEKDDNREGVDGYVPVNIKFHYLRKLSLDETKVKDYYTNTVSKILSEPLRNDKKEPHVIMLENQTMNVTIGNEAGHMVVTAEAYGVPRHPAQLYEAFYCVLIFLGLFHLWYHNREQLPEGFMIGLFLTVLFSLRFVDEFFKINQVPFEENIPLNMGQWLSVPFVLIGILVMILSYKRKKKLTT